MTTQSMEALDQITYDVHPSVAMVRAWIDSLAAKTGRDLEGWLRLVREEGPATEQERREWLKREHGLGTNAASWIADRFEEKGWEDGDPDTYLRAAAEYVEAMFAGKRATLRPLYLRLLELARCAGRRRTHLPLCDHRPHLPPARGRADPAGDEQPHRLRARAEGRR